MVYYKLYPYLRFLTFLLFVSLGQHLIAQTGTIQGRITDVSSGDILIGVNVVADSLHGTSSNTDGMYIMELEPGNHSLSFSFIGFESQEQTIVIVAGENRTINIQLQSTQIALETAVITAGKFRQQISDVTVSMEIIRPEFIENTNTVNIETVINQMPGVDVMDGQASIRGGGGYSFGAGSRVQLLVDELPMLTADVNEVKWNFLPVENIANVEILKGASSSLYGSSALNGVINILTAWPGEKPETTINIFGGLYMKPDRKEMAWWWDNPKAFGGASLSTTHRLGTVDLVAGANVYSNEGYRQENHERRVRANVKVRHRPTNIKGLTYGLSTNIQWQHSSDFFIWQNADSGAYMQIPGGASPTYGFRFNADPWITYYDNKENRHNLKMRYYSVYNKFDTKPENDNGSQLFYGEYQYQREFRKRLNVTAGFMGLYGITDAQLFGDHYNSNIAIYGQVDYKITKRLNASLGLRWEQYTLDNTDRESSDVMRAGLNYKVAKYTFLRGSFGQGYRFPSIAEKYTVTSVGGLNVFANPLLKSETGWSGEIGIKQGFQLGSWKGYLDIAGYWTEYENMIEFTFGVWAEDSIQNPTLDDIGFKFLNVGKAQINGVDLNITGMGEIGKVPVIFFLGYTYMNPVDLSSDTLENDMLKYRYKHSFKGDIEVNPGKFSTGLSFRYNSFMERIDEAFEDRIFGQEIFPGLKDYRLENNNGALVFDLRVAYQISALAKVSILVKNIFNEEYMGRPGNLQPPRNITLQLLLKI